MIAKEGCERGQLHPARQQFPGRILQEAAGVSAAKWDAAETEIQQHLNGVRQVFPTRTVVSRPDQRVTLHPCVAGARDDKWPLVGLPRQRSFSRRACHLHSINIVGSGMAERAMV